MRPGRSFASSGTCPGPGRNVALGSSGGGLLKVLTAFREKSVVRLCFGLVWVGFFGLLGFFFPNLLGIVEQALMLSMCKAAWVFLELCLL